jgi:hypothetical protein
MFGLLTIIFSLLVISLNPASSFQDARNAERVSEMSQIMTSVNLFEIGEDSRLNSLTYSDGKPLPVCEEVDSKYTNGIPFPSLDIAPTIISSGYMSEHPTDPQGGVNPYYNICYKTRGGQLTIYAPNIEGEITTLTR